MESKSSMIGEYKKDDNMEFINWKDGVVFVDTWESFPKLSQLFLYKGGQLKMMRIFGSWDYFMNGYPLHVDKRDNMFSIYLDLPSGFYYFYFEGAQEMGRNTYEQI